MIVGKGLIAKAIQKIDKENIIFFCSGVSDSTTNDLKQFEREKKLLHSINRSKKLIYFSTISVCDENDKRPYVCHKREMELIVSKKDFIIFRIPQVLGYSGNKKNIINFFVDKIKNGETIKIQEKAKRSIIDVDDVVNLVEKNINQKNKTINISGFEVLYVSELIKKIFSSLKLETKIETEEGYENFIPNNDINIDLEKNYTQRILNKYLNGN